MALINNWIVIYPYKDLTIIKKKFEELKLKDFMTGIIVVNDNLSKKEESEYMGFINKNLKYNGHVNVCPEKDLTEVIEGMGGVDNDNLYLIKEGNVISKKLNFSNEDEE